MSIKGMKISVDAGHNCGVDGGAVGIGNENIMNRVVTNLVIKGLKAEGAIVKDCTPTIPQKAVRDSLRLRCQASNSFGAQLHVCIHHNSGGGHGSEVLYVSDTGKVLAQSIVTELAKLGYTNRGAKKDDDLYVLNHTKCVAILTEGCFVDSPADMKLYNAQKEATAIVEGILKVYNK